MYIHPVIIVIKSCVVAVGMPVAVKMNVINSIRAGRQSMSRVSEVGSTQFLGLWSAVSAQAYHHEPCHARYERR